MCVIVAKYLSSTGWVLMKNRDRNYRPTITMKSENREKDDLSLLYMYDLNSKYGEGINSSNIGIISSATFVSRDELEGQTGNYGKKVEYAPDGVAIRGALRTPGTIKDCISTLLEKGMIGNTLLSNGDDCYLVESYISDAGEYKVEVRQLPNVVGSAVVRSNHGVLLEDAGYRREDDEFKRKSTELRKEMVEAKIGKANSITEIIDILSVYNENSEPQFNPLRWDSRESAMRTTGQLLVIPKQKKLLYRSIFDRIEDKVSTLDTGLSYEWLEPFSVELSERSFLNESLKEEIKTDGLYTFTDSRDKVRYFFESTGILHYVARVDENLKVKHIRKATQRDLSDIKGNPALSFINKIK